MVGKQALNTAIIYAVTQLVSSRIQTQSGPGILVLTTEQCFQALWACAMPLKPGWVNDIITQLVIHTQEPPLSRPDSSPFIHVFSTLLMLSLAPDNHGCKGNKAVRCLTEAASIINSLGVLQIGTRWRINQSLGSEAERGRQGWAWQLCFFLNEEIQI